MDRPKESQGMARSHELVQGSAEIERILTCSRTTSLESLGIPHRIGNLALESGIFGSIEVRLFQETSGYFDSARLRSAF